MSMNNQGRVTAPNEISYATHESFSGNKALDQATKLIFETGSFQENRN
jgi:hypothetical protein